MNYTAISNETGISSPTVKSHYQLLEDMYIGFFVSAFSKSQRKNLLSTPKFLFFDTGVRNSAAGLTPSPQTVMANPGPVFEQWVGIELWKRLGYLGSGRLFYMRTKDGFEIDFIIELADGSLIPVEVKWTENPNAGDARHLVRFIDENRKCCQKGFVVCRCKNPMQITDNVTAISWKDL
jgi:predicted AAA+ superfamily ATPase